MGLAPACCICLGYLLGLLAFPKVTDVPRTRVCTAFRSSPRQIQKRRGRGMYVPRTHRSDLQLCHAAGAQPRSDTRCRRSSPCKNPLQASYNHRLIYEQLFCLPGSGCSDDQLGAERKQSLVLKHPRVAFMWRGVAPCRLSHHKAKQDNYKHVPGPVSVRIGTQKFPGVFAVCCVGP